MTRSTVLAIVASTILFLYILEMVRRRKLREEYSILWLAGSIVMLALTVKRSWLEWIARGAGIYYAPSFLFLVAILFILLILIHFSIAVSKLHQMNKTMAQELALLKERTAETGSAGGSPPRPRSGSLEGGRGGRDAMAGEDPHEGTGLPPSRP